jgi:hypothetical protein
LFHNDFAVPVERSSYIEQASTGEMPWDIMHSFSCIDGGHLVLSKRITIGSSTQTLILEVSVFSLRNAEKSKASSSKLLRIATLRSVIMVQNRYAEAGGQGLIDSCFRDGVVIARMKGASKTLGPLI